MLVCRDFNALYTPSLHSIRACNLYRLRHKNLRHLSLPPRLDHLTELCAYIADDWKGYWSEAPNYPEGLHKDYSHYLARLIQAMPKLTSFWLGTWDWNITSADSWYRWDAWTDPEYETADIIRDSAVVKALSSASKLTNLHVTFAWEISRSSEIRLLDLTSCSILTSVELHNCHGPQEYLIERLSVFLSRCSNLKVFGLSLATRQTSTYAIIIDDDDHEFLEKLCNAYHSLKTTPLTLHTLKLGHGLCPLASWPFSQSKTYINELVKLTDLRILHLFNGLVRLGDDYDGVEQELPVDWILFKDCNSLSQVSLTQLDWGVVKWLNCDATEVHEIFLLG